MSEAVIFKCPACGAYLEFDPQKQAFVCPYCGKEFDEAALKAQSAGKEETAQAAEKTDTAAQDAFRAYHCQTCGAEVVTGDTTAATRCYYCHSPIVLSDRLSEAFRPDSVIPFKLTREEAEQKFEQYLSKKRFVDRRFFDASQRENISGVYYPYWLTDIEGDAAFEGEGRRVNVVNTRRETITTTRIFSVHREGRVTLRNIIRQALSSNDRQLSDGIHPYDMNEAKPFAMGYLSGFLAEKRDVEAAALHDDLKQEAQRHADRMIRQNSSFDSLSGKTGFTARSMEMRYCLLPTWVLTYRGDQPGKTFYFMMNGQTGQTCGRLPIDWRKLLVTAGIVGAAVCGLMCAGGALLW